jgi:hypothetical protein
MADRNALPLIEKALQEKLVKVTLPNTRKQQDLFLIHISGDVFSFIDVERTYHDISRRDLVILKDRLSEEKQKNLQHHGVFIDSKTLKIVFSFNMAFADLDKERGKLVRFPFQEVFPIVIPDYYGYPCCDGELCFGERAKKLVQKYGYAPSDNVSDCLLTFIQVISKHIVQVQLPGESVIRSLFLIKVWAKTDTEEDIRTAYPDSKSLPGLGPKEDFREYGLCIDQNLKLFFAFNTALAEYDSEAKRISYSRGIRDANKSSKSSTIRQSVDRPKFPQIPPTIQRPRSGGMSGVIMYALLEPRQKEVAAI